MWISSRWHCWQGDRDFWKQLVLQKNFNKSLFYISSLPCCVMSIMILQDSMIVAVITLWYNGRDHVYFNLKERRPHKLHSFHLNLLHVDLSCDSWSEIDNDDVISLISMRWPQINRHMWLEFTSRGVQSILVWLEISHYYEVIAIYILSKFEIGMKFVFQVTARAKGVSSV